jgi:two-component system sensor histidine kinase DegS
MMLDDLGLIPTIRRYLNAFKDKTDLEVNLVVTGTERRLEEHYEVLVFRAFQDVLANVRGRPGASKVKVTVDVRDEQVRMSIEDDGQAADPQAGDEGTVSGQRRDLQELRDRIDQVGGTIEVQSTPGQGRRISISIPTGT